MEWCKGTVWFNRTFMFFGKELYMNPERAKDVRIYEQSVLAKRELDKLIRRNLFPPPPAFPRFGISGSHGSERPGPCPDSGRIHGRSRSGSGYPSFSPRGSFLGMDELMQREIDYPVEVLLFFRRGQINTLILFYDLNRLPYIADRSPCRAVAHDLQRLFNAKEKRRKDRRHREA